MKISNLSALFRLTGSLVLSVSLTGSSAWAFVPTSSGISSLADNGDGISVKNPQSIGEFKPRLSGNLAMTTLTFNHRSGHWFTLASDRGAIQLWGDPIFAWPEQMSLKDMDLSLRQFTDENFGALQVHSSDLVIDNKRTRYSGPFRYITYQRVVRVEDQVFPVESAFITFRFKFDRLVQVTNYTFGDIGMIEAPSVGADDALQVVKDDLNFDETNDHFTKQVRAELQPFYTGPNAIHFRVVYQVSVKKGKTNLWHYSVSGSDGQIVRLLNGLTTAGTVMGEAIPRFPHDTPAAIAFPETLVSGDGQKELTDESGNFTLDSENATAELSGARATIKQAGKTKVSQQVGSDGNIVFKASSHLSENSVYIHINQTNAWVRQFIKGIPGVASKIAGRPTFDFLNSPITANTHAETASMKECNAWYDPSTGQLNFLEESNKCEASAHYADVVYHEWGHALDDALGGIQDGAFSEAIGDINAYFQTHDPRIGMGFVKATPDKPIRDISMPRVYPKDRGNGEPHLESLIISSTWFGVIDAFKKEHGDEEGLTKAAELFYKHLISTDAYMDSYMGALLVDDDDGNMNNCTPHMCILNAVFAKHGLTKADPRCGTSEFSQHAAANLPACAQSTLGLNN